MSDSQDDSKYAGKEEEAAKPWWQEAVKDLTLSGLATLFMTEDSIRTLLREKKFPKEMVGLLLDGVNKKKDDAYGMMVKEIGRVLGKIDMGKEFTKFLETHRVEVSAKLTFEKKEPGAKNEPGHSINLEKA